jgi:peptidoglycan/LPS O-acetylase OafA/YrhL
VQSGYAAYKQQRYFPSLDGVRAVAVILAFPLAVLIAWVIHVTFEKPLVRVGHKLARRDKPFHAV